MGLRTSMNKLWHWLKTQWIEEVPDHLAICEFECRKSQCSSDDWARCVRRASNPPKKLVSLRHSPGTWIQRQVA